MPKLVVSGTVEERGLIQWKKQLGEDTDAELSAKQSSTYDIPLITKYIRKVACFSYLPVCPTFNGCRKHKDEDIELRVHDSQPNSAGRYTQKVKL